MKSDDEIKRDVEAELRWSPQINATDIAVKVNGGEVTLSGFTGSYYEKYQADTVARRVKGVAALANEIQVTLATGAPTDPEIARAALTALQYAVPFTREAIKPNKRLGLHPGSARWSRPYPWNCVWLDRMHGVTIAA